MDDELRKTVWKHDTDLYRGNGKPGLTVRMALVEERIETVKETVEQFKRDSRAIKIMVATAILTMACEIVVRLVTH